MFSKKILFAGIAAAALCAGQASALTLVDTTNPSKVGGVSITSTTSYKVANNLISSTALTAATGNVILNTVLTAGNLAAGQYYVQYDITGATFDTQANVSDAALAGRLSGTQGGGVTAIAGLSPNVQARGTTSVKFLVTVDTNLASRFAFNAPIVLAAPGTVTVTATVTTDAGVVQDLGATTATIITAGAPYKIDSTSVACNQVARIAQASPATYPTFGSFAAAASCAGSAVVAGDVTAPLGTIVFATNSGTYKDLAGTAVALSDIASFGATASGATLNSTAQVNFANGVPTSKTSTAGSASISGFTFTAAAPTITVTVGQDLSVALTTASAYTALTASPFVYSIQPAMTSSTTFSTPAALTATLGSISLEGTTFKAAWVGDGSNGYNYVLRIGNSGSSAVGPVTINAVNPVGTTTATSCPVGNIPAKGELQVNSAALKTCFGAFTRSDLTVVVNASTTNLTAKMRVVSPNQTASEVSLGGGVTTASTN